VIIYSGSRLEAYRCIADLPPDDVRHVGRVGSFYETAAWAAYCERTSAAQTLYFSAKSPGPFVTTAWLSEDAVDGLIGCKTRQSAKNLVLAPQKCYESPLWNLEGCVDAQLEDFIGDVREVAAQLGATGVLAPFVEVTSARALISVVGVERVLLTGGRSVIPVPDTFDDYLGSLSRNRRSAVRREMRTFEAAGLEIRRLNLADFPEVCAPLIAETQGKYGIPVSVDVLTNQLNVMRELIGDDVVAFVADAGGNVVGTSVLFRHRGHLIARMVGFRYGALTDSFEYFQLLAYAPMRFCLQNGLDRLDLGFGAHEGKVNRGAVLHPTFAVDLSVEPLWSLADRQDVNVRTLEELEMFMPDERTNGISDLLHSI
jgi:hypothetical protein